MAFIVQRLPGDKPAPDSIVSSMLTDDIAKTERGTQFINYNDSDRKLIAAELTRKGLLDYNTPALVVLRDGSIKGAIITDVNFDFAITPDGISVTSSTNLEMVKGDD